MQPPDKAECQANRSTAVTILGVRVHHRTTDEAMQHISTLLSEKRHDVYQIATVNPEFVMLARRDPEFAGALRNVDLATADGVGIVLASRLLGSPIPERLTGVELTERLAALTSPRPRLFLLGAAPGVAQEAAERLSERFPGVQIAGVYSGHPGEDERTEILNRIRQSGADTLLVAFGAPAQELWIARSRQALAACGIVLAIGVGGTFDFISGRVPRAPQLIRRAGLEWLYRLIRQPWRWRRQLVLPLFAALVLKERLRGKGKASVTNHGSTER